MKFKKFIHYNNKFYSYTLGDVNNLLYNGYSLRSFDTFYGNATNGFISRMNFTKRLDFYEV